MDISITLGAGGVQEIPFIGRYFYVYSASASGTVGLRFAGGDTIYREASQGGEVTPGARSVRVSSVLAQTIVLIFQDSPIQNDVDNVAVAVTANVTPGNTLDNGGDVSLVAGAGPGATTTIRAADANALSVLVKADIANTETVRVGTTGVGAATGYPLDPGESVSISSTALIAGYNPSTTTAQNVHVLPVRQV